MSVTVPAALAHPVLKGAWPDAARVAGACVGSMLGLSFVLVLLLDLPGIGLWDELALAGALTGAAFGADATLGADYRDSGTALDLSAYAGGVPLVVTLAGLGLATYLLRRQLRGTPAVGDGLRQSGRVAVLVAAALAVVALVLRSDFSSVWGEISQLEGLEAGVGAHRAGAPLLGFLVTLAVLGASCLLRRDWLTDGLLRLHDVAAAPLRGLGVLLLLLPAAGLVAYATLLSGHLPDDPTGGLDDDQLDWRRRVVLGVLGAGNVGLGFLGVGSGGRLGARAEGRAEGELDLGYAVDLLGLPGDLGSREAADGAWWGRLATLQDHTDMWALWLAVPTALLVLGAAAWVVVATAQRAPRPLVPVVVWCATLLLGLPLLARLTGLHARARVEARFVDTWGGGGDGSLSAGAWAGLAPWDGLLLALLGIALTLVVVVSAAGRALRPPGRRPRGPRRGG